MIKDLDEYLKLKEHFQLGSLTTESFHPLSMNLSSVLQQDITEGINILQQIDKEALAQLESYSEQIYSLYQQVQECFKQGGRVFLCGCGATGRLALSMEKIFLTKFKEEKVISFMAGGDYALVSSVESFEDSAEYGARQLNELGFNEKDLLLSITEGGETSFVIGAAKEAAKRSLLNPYFLYCNPDEELMGIDRSRDVLLNTKIKKLNLNIGAMAISGSTRMQATTVQMIATGVALLYQFKSKQDFEGKIKEIITNLSDLDLRFLKNYIQEEHSLYKDQGKITYVARSDLAIAILTDTTERSPTFSMLGFENLNYDDHKESLSYLVIENEKDNKRAWQSILGRSPRCLNWKDVFAKVEESDLLGFDMSALSIERRNAECFYIRDDNRAIQFLLKDYDFKLEVQDDLFIRHLVLKVVLNIHSTLVMGLLGRFEGNMMTYVRPSNLKLIDRTYRYLKQISKTEKKGFSEKEILKMIFDHLDNRHEPIIQKIRELYY